MNSFKLMYSVPLRTNGDEKHDKTNAVLKLQNASCAANCITMATDGFLLLESVCLLVR